MAEDHAAVNSWPLSSSSFASPCSGLIVKGAVTKLLRSETGQLGICPDNPPDLIASAAVECRQLQAKELRGYFTKRRDAWDPSGRLCLAANGGDGDVQLTSLRSRRELLQADSFDA